MPARWRKPLLLVALLAILTLATASRSRRLDFVLTLLFWVALLAGSVVVAVKARRGREGEARERYGQAAALPASWRRWVAGETGETPQGKQPARR
jgi:hypothetical protein